MKRNYLIVSLVFLIFFVISLLTNVSGPLLPDIQNSFNLSKGLAAFLPFAFFLAYGVMSIPSGMIIDRWGEKPVIVGAFVLAFLGSCLFAFKPIFSVAMLSLFTIGVGMAMLQVAINPLLRVSGGEENYAFFGVMAQLIFGAASAFSPYLYSHLVEHLGKPQGPQSFLTAPLTKVVSPSMPWISMYWLFTVVTLAMIVVMLVVKLPKVERKDDEKAGSLAVHVELIKSKTVRLFFIGIFSYVAIEQGVSNWISKFLSDYHHLDPQTTGAKATGNFWLAMTVGCAVGLLVLKLWDSRKVLIGFGIASAVTLAAALLGPAAVAVWAFPLVGFWFSIMWGVVFSLALNSVSSNHGSLAGILCTGIVGGAVSILLVGNLGDWIGLRAAMAVIFVPLGYVISIGFWARPLITNATVGKKAQEVAA